MSDLKAAAQQVLEYMKSVGKMDMHPEEWAIVGRLEAALAEPDDEPTYCPTCGEEDGGTTCGMPDCGLRCGAEPVQDKRTTITDLRCAKWLDPECAEEGACQSLKFKRPVEPVQEPFGYYTSPPQHPTSKKE